MIQIKLGFELPCCKAALRERRVGATTGTSCTELTFAIGFVHLVILHIATMVSTLVIGFDSAWSENNSGAIVGVLKQCNGSYKSLGNPSTVNFDQATAQINNWEITHRPTTTLILIDQPTIVPNMNGQRPVENIVGSTVGRRYGGVQPANRSKATMFGDGAPIWLFLEAQKACLDPTKFPESPSATWIIETYPVLTLIALNMFLEDDHPNPRPTGRLPKYNPANQNFLPGDWRSICEKAADSLDPLKKIKLQHLAKWIDDARSNPLPALRQERKRLQDCLDACLCLLVGLYLIEGRECLMVGNIESGYMVVPHGEQLHVELVARCMETGRPPADWIRKLKF